MKPRWIFSVSFFVLFCFCNPPRQTPEDKEELSSPSIEQISLVVLGTVQDGGSPHIGCQKDCCKHLFESPDPNRKVVSLGLVDPGNDVTFIFEATPDFPEQVEMLGRHGNDERLPDGIFLTHAHIGHYSGLMYLGREAVNANSIPVYAMPRMKSFLEENGPWSQLVSIQNIAIQPLQHRQELFLSDQISVIPFSVPHRDEFSETVGYQINGLNKKALFIPDIDKWDKWDRDIIEEIAKVDYAFLDATFFDGEEINHRDISEIPHPFIIESMEKFRVLPASEKAKIYFIHFNHTNPALHPESAKAQAILSEGYHIAQFGDIIPL